MYRSKSFYCPFCHAGPFPKRVALASHISQRAQCSAAALAQAHKHINPPVDDGPSIVASQSPPTLVFNNPSEPLELESDRSPSPNSQPPKRPRDDDPQSSHFNPFTLLFPGEKNAGQAYDYHGTPFEQEFQSQVELGKEPWDPFADSEEWELADWFMTAEVAQEDIDKYLKLKITRQRTQVSFKDKQQFFKKVDALPRGPGWERIIMNVKGDQLGPDGKELAESLEIWARDPVDCIKEILGNPSFKDKVSYSPRKEYIDPEMRQRVYTEMATADWWWKVQERLPKGATIASVIIASDKTQLSRMGGDKSAWPVYITIGNIDKATRRKPSRHATILLGYLPVTKLEIFSHTATRQLMGQDLFHRCMKLLLEPLERAGREGVRMVCPDGYVRQVYPILAAYIADHPEQCLVTCTKENRCPQCKVPADERGEPSWIHYPGRSQSDTLTILKNRARGDSEAEEEAREEGLRATYPPFWAELPHTDIFSCITPDILHQIHKGMFKSHLFQWCQDILGTAEMDQRFSAMPSHPSLRHFHRGVSHLTQWTGKEAKQLERVFVGTMVGAVDNRTLIAIRALLDFFVLAQYDTHTDESLELMEESLSAFHKNKHYAFGNQRDQFNFPKLHSLVHYTSAIRSLGTLDGYNSELPERLHIDFAKKAYNASNKRDYINQMTVWLRRQEAVHRLRSYLAWVRPRRETPRNPDADSDGEAADNEAVQEATSRVPGANRFRIVKNPHFRRLSATVISMNFHAPRFLPSLREFLVDNLAPHLFRPPYITDRFDVFKTTVVRIDPISLKSRPFYERIRAFPSHESGLTGLSSGPARFDTVLVKISNQAANRGVRGFRVGRVRCIFRVPPEIAIYNHPLVYIEWFTEFKPLKEKGIDMYEVQRAIDLSGTPLASVVRLGAVRRSCHLLPNWGKKANLLWTNENVLDVCPSFYLNDFLDSHLYQAL